MRARFGDVGENGLDSAPTLNFPRREFFPLLLYLALASAPAVRQDAQPVDVEVLLGQIEGGPGAFIRGYYGKLAIPNEDVKIVYEDMFRNWLYRATPERAYVDDLVHALFWGDAETIQEIWGEMLVRVLSRSDGQGGKCQSEREA